MHPAGAHFNVVELWPEGTVVKDNYVIERKLGSGGFGTVYLARHRLRDTHHVIKRLHEDLASNEEFIRKFAREFKVIQRLRTCPNIVEVELMTQTADGHLILVMEYISGGDLAELMKARPMTIPEVIEATRQIAVALDVAHQAGLVHRDVKPQNVMLSWDANRRPLLKLIDFGIAADHLATTHHKTSMLAGSVGFAAPEQWTMAGKDLDGRADLYSLGATAYCMLTGEMPFEGVNDIGDWFDRARAGRPAPPGSLRHETPPALADLVMALLEFQPDGRPRTAGEVARALADMQAAATEDAAEPIRVREIWPKGTVVKDDYKIEERLGAGGFGTVYLARHRFLATQYVIKRMHQRYAADPDFVDKFVNEGRAIERLKRCPNIVEVKDMTQTADGHLILIMEHVPGGDLAGLMKSRELTIPEVIEAGRQIAVALDAAHKEGLIHRDIKPANVLLSTDAGGKPLLKLIDFGIAADQGSGNQHSSVMRGGSVGYAAPEQWSKAGKHLTGRADLYALGATMYQMLTGKMPFEGTNVVGLWLDRVRQESPVPPGSLRRETSAPLSELVMKMLAFEPESRPASAAVVASSLAAMQVVTPARPPTVVQPPPPEPKPKPPVVTVREEPRKPEPPTPTRSAWPEGLEMMREMRHTCFMASSNKTRSMTALVSLYSLSASMRILYMLG